MKKKKKGTLIILIILFSTIAYSEKNYIEMIKSENPEIRAKAIDGIVNANDKSAIPYLISSLKDKSKIVVKKAIIALSEIGDETAIDSLINISMQFYDQDLQQLATKAIRKITDRVGETGFSPVEEKKSLNNKFFRVSSGYHKESLTTLNDLVTTITRSSSYSSEEKKFSGDTIPIRLDFGYRLDSSAGIGGIGYIPKMSINTKWNNGSTGEMTLSSYFFEFSYRQYLIGGFEEGNLTKKLFPYISGGLGIYYVTWQINDSKIISNSYNPEYSGNQIGLNLSAGAEFFIYKKLSLDIQGGYLFAKIPEIGDNSLLGHFILVDSASKPIDVDLSGVFLLLGINFYVF